MSFNFISRVKTKIGTTVSALLSALGTSGTTTSTLCQTTCTASNSVVPLLGTSLLAFTPLAFLFSHQIIIWWITLVFILILTTVYLKSKIGSKIDLLLIIINSLLLGFSMPYFKDNKSRLFFTEFIGVIIIIGIFITLTLLLFKKTGEEKTSNNRRNYVKY